MVAILATWCYAAEVVVGIVIVAIGEGHITHTKVITLLVLSIQTVVIDLLQFGLSIESVALHTVVSSQSELHLVGKRRAVMLGQKATHTTLRIAHLELRITQRKIVVNLLNLGLVANRREPLSE